MAHTHSTDEETTERPRSDRSRAVGRSRRSKEFALRSSYYWGEAYDHLKAWHAKGSRDEPMRNRAPSVYPNMVYSTIKTANAYLFGAGRLPQFRVEAESDLAELDENGEPIEEAEAEEEFEEAQRELQRIRMATRLDMQLAELGRNGLLHGTVALAGHQLESGRMWSEIVQVADSFPVFASSDREAAEEAGLQDDDLLELDEYWVERKVTLEEEEKLTLHRRLWTTTETIEYEPVEMESASSLDEISWVEDEEKSVVHDLGFVPVVWIRNIRVTGDDEGAPLLGPAEYALQDEICYTLSQLGTAIRYNANPKMYMSDVANMYSRNSEHQMKAGEGQTVLLESYGSGMPAAKMGLLEMNGTGQEAALAYIDTLRRLFERVTSVLEHDPEKAVGALSGTAIERLMMPLVSLVGTLRVNYGAALCRWFELMLRVRGYEGYSVTAIWPSVIEPTPEDLVAIATPVAALYLQGIITLRTAVEVLAPMFGIDNIETYLVELAQEAGAAGGSTSTAAAGARQEEEDPGLFGTSRDPDQQQEDEEV